MCDLYDEGGYGVSFSDRVVKKSRKQHWCEECDRNIAKGSSYAIKSGTWEGDFFSFKVCTRCLKAMKWLNSRGHGWTGGSVLEDVRYCVAQELQDHGTLSKSKNDLPPGQPGVS